MKQIKESHRNMVISTKVSAAQKVELLRLAEMHGVTLSDFVNITVENYKYQFGYIGQDNPEVDKLKKEIKTKERKISRLEANLENADHFADQMLQKKENTEKERDEFRYSVREYAADNDKLKQACSNKDEIIEDLKAELKKNVPTMINNQILKKGMRTNANLNALGAISLGAAYFGFLRR